MLNFKICLSVCLVFFGSRSSTAEEIPIYNCVYEDDWCTFHNLTISRPETVFKLTADNVQNITKLRFNNSSIHTWTSHVCETFPNLVSLEIDQVYLREIAVGALDNCSNLEVISFWTNQLTRFDRDNFRYTYKLKEINVQSNKIYYIHPETFNHLANLEVLSLNENLLKKFPVDKMNRLEKLRLIYLDTNDLEDLDDELLVEKFPGLSTVYMDDNNFDCDRLKEILNTFAAKNISAKVWSAQHKKTRVIKPTTIQGIECYNDQSMRLLMKDSNYQINHLQYLIAKLLEMIYDLKRNGTGSAGTGAGSSTGNAVDRKIIGGLERSLADLKRKTVMLTEANERSSVKLTMCMAMFLLSVVFAAFCAFVIAREKFLRKKVSSSHSMLVFANEQDVQ